MRAFSVAHPPTAEEVTAHAQQQLQAPTKVHVCPVCHHKCECGYGRARSGWDTCWCTHPLGIVKHRTPTTTGGR